MPSLYCTDCHAKVSNVSSSFFSAHILGNPHTLHPRSLERQLNPLPSNTYPYHSHYFFGKYIS